MHFKHSCKAALPLLAIIGSVSFVYTKTAFSDTTTAFEQIPTPAFKAKTQYQPDNSAAWYTRWKLLSEAKSSIYISVFAVHPDIFGRSFLGLLLRKAEEGVQIRLLIDTKASASLAIVGKDYLEELVSHPNVLIRSYNPILGSMLRAPGNLRHLFASMHDKLMIIDEEIAITGGRNFSADYFAESTDMPGAWRDSDIIIQSPDVGVFYKSTFETEFNHARTTRYTKDFGGNWHSKRDLMLYAADAMEHWISGRGPVPTSKATLEWEEAVARYEYDRERGQDSPSGEPMRPDAPDMYNKELQIYSSLTKLTDHCVLDDSVDGTVKVLDKVSYLGSNREEPSSNMITDSLVRLIDATEEQLIIQNPYIVATDKMYAAIKRAHDRGVKILFHTNSPISTDSLFTQAFFVQDWPKLTEQMPNAQIFAFVGTRKLHSKVFVFDRKISVVGSYNMDPMSEQINSEVVSLIHSPELSERILKQIDVDLEESLDLKAVESGTVPAPEAISPRMTRIILKIIRKLKFLRRYS